MSLDSGNPGLGEYRKVEVNGSLNDANPHRVVQVMLQAALDRLSEATGHMERGEVAPKVAAVGKALGIVEGLQLSLDPERGGPLAQNLNDLYEYMTGRLLRANAEDKPELLEEVSALLREIKSGWDAIAAD